MQLDYLAMVVAIVKVLGTIGGAFYAVFGAIHLFGALKDKNGPDIQGGIWQLLGGAGIIAAAQWFGSINTTLPTAPGIIYNLIR